MKALVTGVAGFVGSTLAEELISRGWQVVGIDCFTSVYDPTLKRANLNVLSTSQNFQFICGDIGIYELDEVVDGMDVVFHLAAVPGVRASWAGGFEDYARHNIIATQKLLEVARSVKLPRLVFASSSSVYGNQSLYPSREDDLPRPHSPYGVSKLAAEYLCKTYSDVYSLDVVLLRYFSVYGPRQRPDMGLHRLIEAALGRAEFVIYGDGKQVRDMTYVMDAVTGTIEAALQDIPPGSVINIAGGSAVSLLELVRAVELATGGKMPFVFGEIQPGDVQRTGGLTEVAQKFLGWTAQTSLAEGLLKQVAWHKGLERSFVAS